MRDLEVFAQDGAGFVLHKEEGEERGCCVEEAGGVGFDGGSGEGGGGVAEFVDGGFCWGFGGRRRRGGWGGSSTAVGGDWEWGGGVG